MLKWFVVLCALIVLRIVIAGNDDALFTMRTDSISAAAVAADVADVVVYISVLHRVFFVLM